MDVELGTSVGCHPGVSLASGIPDSRSPGGVYATFRPKLLTATPLQL